MWMYIAAANNGHPITDAVFSANAYNNMDGNYYVYIGQGVEFWCEAPNYRVTYDNTDRYAYMRISLVFTGSTAWPNTQTY